MNGVHNNSEGEKMPKIIENLPVSILDAAGDILSEQGFADFSIRAVAKKLDIAPATIYNYYPSKECILEALADEAWHKLMESVDRETENIKEPLAALEIIYSLLQNAMNPMFSHWLNPEDRTRPQDHPNAERIMAKKQTIAGELTRRIETILSRCGKDASKAEVFTKLFIMCSHHRGLSFGDIVAAVTELK